jgi:putative FmdB family regulatory protein
MPFYEYQCKSCRHELEAMQKVSDAPLKKCPHCGKAQLQRLMSAPVFRLKGSGWYETDFKDDKDKKRNLAEHPEAESTKETDAKTDAKSDAKVDDKGGASAEKPAGGEGAKSKDGSAAKLDKKPVPGADESAAKKADIARPRRSSRKPTAKPRHKK